MREALKYFHLNTVLLSENDHFSIRSLFVYTLRIRYLGKKGARAQILLGFFIPNNGLLVAKRWDLKALYTWGTSLVS